MKFWKLVESALRVKYFLFIPLFIAILASTTTLSSLRDQTHEIEIVGSSWIDKGSILYVQTWSHYSPQTLAIGALYSVVQSDVIRILIEVLFVIVVGLLLNANLRLTMGDGAKTRAMLLLASTSLLIPGSWERGVTPAKLALLFINLMFFGYLSWKNSSTSYWFLGKTSKNWRYLLLAGISMSLTLFTSWFYALFIVPVVVDFLRYRRGKNYQKLRWSAFFVVPILVESWILISALVPRNLLGTAFQNSLLDLRIFSGDVGLFRNSWALFVSTIILVTCALISVRSQSARKEPAAWVVSMIVILTTLFLPVGILQSTVIVITFAGLLYSNTASKVLRPGVVAVCAIFLIVISLPLRTLLQSQLQLDKSSAQIAISYVDQRLVDTRFVYYYGSSAGFYELSEFDNPTRFYDARVFEYDNGSLELADKFRGDSEAERPLFVVYATGEQTKAPKIDRLEEYFTKHYTEVADIEGYKILKRTTSL